MTDDYGLLLFRYHAWFRGPNGNEEFPFWAKDREDAEWQAERWAEGTPLFFQEVSDEWDAVMDRRPMTPALFRQVETLRQSERDCRRAASMQALLEPLFKPAA